MRVVFMGTPDFAVPCLEIVADHFQVVAVITQPDRKKGRGQKIHYSPVKQAALEREIPVLQPMNINAPESLAAIRALKPELLVVVAYGQLLRKQLLGLAELGAINVHASLLPHLRGGAPIHHAILRGFAKTGVTTMRIARKLDAGPILLQEETPIAADESVGDLHDRLAVLGANLLLETLQQLGQITPQPQDDSQASYAANISAQERIIVWTRSAQEIHNQIRGLNPWPIAYTTYRGKQLQVMCATLLSSDEKTACAPGTIVEINAKGLIIQCGSGLIGLQEVRPASKKRMAVSDFCRGYRCQIGECLGKASN